MQNIHCHRVTNQMQLIIIIIIITIIIIILTRCFPTAEHSIIYYDILDCR